MDYFNNPSCTERRHELEAEYMEAPLIIRKGQPLTLGHSLRKSLSCVAREIQRAMDDRLVVTEDDLAMLCVAQAKKTCTEKQAISDHARTLFERSRSLLNG